MVILYCLLVINAFGFSTSQSSSIWPSKSSITIQPTVAIAGTMAPLETPTPVIVTFPPTEKLACDSNPCFNGATCTNLFPRNTNYKCDCANGWTGVNCDFSTSGFKAKTGVQYFKVENFTISSTSSVNIVYLLFDNSTDLFKETCDVFKTNLNNTISASDPSILLLNLRCLSFTFSSYYYVTYIMDFPTSNKISTQRLLKAIDSGIQLHQNKNLTAGLVYNSTLIEDLDECQNSPGYCHPSAICSNNIGGYTCHCPIRYIMQFNGQCQETTTNSNNMLAILLPTVCGTFLLFVVALCLFIAVRRKRACDGLTKV
nr:protein crumbs-like [Hydra vulgaris]